MYDYSLSQWLFFFYFYSFWGWCFESAYVSVCEKRLVNRGFMRGPFLPLYGVGAIMMLLVSIPFQGNLLFTFLAGCVGATVLEYVTGVVMERLFKMRYWDYSHKPYNYKGYICLESTLVWGALTILVTKFLHKLVERFVLGIPEKVLFPVVLVLTVVISADFALSFKAALDLRDVLIRMEDTKRELARIKKRLDVIIAVAGEDISAKREELSEEWKSLGFEEVKQGVEECLAKLRKAVSERERSAESSGVHLESVREEWMELTAQYRRNLSERSRLSSLKNFFQRDMIRSNPTMTSRRFEEALEELKKTVREHKRG